MMILYGEKNEYGCYPGIQKFESDTVPDGFLEIQDCMLSEFYKEGKESGGFVDLQVEGSRIVDVTWNEEAYQAWLSSRPEPEPAPPSLEDRFAALEAENAALTAAIERGLSL